MKLGSRKFKSLLGLLPALVSCAPVPMLTAFLGNACIGLFPTLSALSTAWFIDAALKLAAGSMTGAEMILPTVCMLLVQALDFCRWEVDSFCMGIIEINLLRYFRPELMKKAASLEYRHIEDGKTWDLIHRMCDKPDEKMFNILDGFVYLAQLTVGLIGVLALVAAQVWWAALVIGVCFAPVIYISLKIGRRNYEEKAKIETDMRRFEALRKICVDREPAEERAAFGFGDYIAGEYEEEFERAHRNMFRYWKHRSVGTGAMQCLFVLVMVATAAVLSVPAMNGAITIGTMVAIVREVLNLSTRMGGLNYCMRCISEGNAYAKDLSRYMALSEQEGALDEAAEEAPPLETLEFKHVSFAYPDSERKILNDFSLKLERGKHYAFVGVNGAGKTTLTKLICGLYDQFEGEILLNGKDIRSYSQAQIKALCSVVFQDFVRYQTSMRDAITLGNAQCAEKLEGVLKATGLDETAAALSKGLDTPLGKVYEGGQDLSGGQWQKMAIARTLVRNAPLRILDEPTAALDPVSESEFYERFGEMSRGCTTIFISHRLGSTKLADRIFVLDGGKIAEEGTQEELLSKNGLYAEMYEAQRSWYQ